ncbi:hypothetical protein ACPPVW_07815 [Leifsonia sp. McL0607]|uniref:hypothetical protein n=1 Tax=Leifsonia sp. McL0607 TaxID=3415672 RepID=UPI003CF277E9
MIARSGWSVLRAVGLVASVVASIIATIRQVALGSDPDSVDPVVLGVVVVLLFALVYVLTRPKVAAIQVPGSRLLGAITYPLYLTHAVFGYALLDLWVNPYSIWPGVAVALAVVLAVSAAIHFGVERAGARLWRSMFRFVFWPIAKLEVWLSGRSGRAGGAGSGMRAAAGPPTSPFFLRGGRLSRTTCRNRIRVVDSVRKGDRGPWPSRRGRPGCSTSCRVVLPG